MQKSNLPDYIIRSSHFDMAIFKRLLFAKVIPTFRDACINHLKCFVIIVAIILFGSSLGYANNPANPTVQDIEHELQKSGPSGTVYWLTNGFKFNEKTPWNFVMDQVALGKSEWIALVPKLDPGTDENTAYRFSDVLAEALPNNPTAVLSIMVLDDSGHQDYAYLGPIICMARGFDRAETLPYVKNAMAAISKVQDPNLQKAKATCLSELNKIKLETEAESKYINIPPTVKSVQHDIETIGPDKTVSKLNLEFKTDQNTPWDFVMDQVALGKSEWIALVPKLVPGTDGMTSEALPIYVADALPRNPVAVLSIMDLDDSDGWNYDHIGPIICAAPFFEGGDEDIPAYIKKAQAAVLKVSVPSLQKAKAVCLAELQKAADELKQTK